MNTNLIAYSIYSILTIGIIVRVGALCYTHGKIYVAHLVPRDVDFGLRINSMLLVAYYLVNIGYAIITLSNWEPIQSSSQLIATIAYHTGTIVLILAGLHYFNLIWITLFIQKLTTN